MSETGYPVCFDIAHSVQMPTSMGKFRCKREFIPALVMLLLVLMHFYGGA